MSTHQVTITLPEPECEDDIEWEVRHLENTQRCVIWFPCKKCSEWEERKLSARYDLNLTDDVVYHGVEHQVIEGEWMVPTDYCGLQEGDSCDWVHDIYRERGPGTYPVEPDYWGEGIWIGHLSEEAS